MAKKISISYFLLCLLLLAVSCQSLPTADTSASVMLGRQMYTATNLRLFQDQYIYWQNRLDGKLLPIGTMVRVMEINQETVKLIDNKNSIFLLHWQDPNAEDRKVFSEVSHRYLRADDPKPEWESWSDADRTALQSGDIRRGMVPQQVLLAWGYPPGVADPKNQETWLYWLNSWKMCAVRFENGVVAEIVR